MTNSPQITKPPRPWWGRLWLKVSVTLLVVLVSAYWWWIWLPGSIPAPVAGLDPIRARQIVTASIDAHGGYAHWQSVGPIQARASDHWPNTWPSPPYPINPGTGTLVFDYAKNKGLWTFHEPQKTMWFFDGAVLWTRTKQSKYHSAKDWNLAFKLTAVAYFMHMPFKLLDPGVNLLYLGRGQWRGKAVERVLVTFGAGVGLYQDRYEMFFDRSTKRLLRMRFVLGASRNFFTAEAIYHSWTKACGLLMPQRVQVGMLRMFRFPTLHQVSFSQYKCQVKGNIFPTNLR